jgi:hypothetical protein
MSIFDLSFIFKHFNKPFASHKHIHCALWLQCEIPLKSRWSISLCTTFSRTMDFHIQFTPFFSSIFRIHQLLTLNKATYGGLSLHFFSKSSAYNLTKIQLDYHFHAFFRTSNLKDSLKYSSASKSTHFVDVHVL